MFTPGVSNTGDDEIATLFGLKTPGADDLLSSKKEKEEPAAPAKTENKTETDPVPSGAEQPEVDTSSELDILLGEATQTEPTAGKEKTTPAAKSTTPAKKEEPTISDTHEINYQAIYEDMVAEGVWEEVEVPEGTQWDKDLFKKIQKLQVSAQVDSVLDKTGPIGKQIIEYENNGGNPSELLNLFREQRDIRDYDLSDSDSQEEFLRAYLETQGNSDKSINRIITALKDEGGEALKEEAEEKKALWAKHYDEEISQVAQEQAERKRQLDEAQKNFTKNITSTLTSDPEMSLKDRRALQSYILNFDQNYSGRQVSQFYVDMAEIQKDPKNYVELAKFIRGLKTGEYKKTVEDKAKKETTAASYLRIKGGNALTTAGGSTTPAAGKEESNFLKLLTKK